MFFMLFFEISMLCQIRGVRSGLGTAISPNTATRGVATRNSTAS